MTNWLPKTTATFGSCSTSTTLAWSSPRFTTHAGKRTRNGGATSPFRRRNVRRSFHRRCGRGRRADSGSPVRSHVARSCASCCPSRAEKSARNSRVGCGAAGAFSWGQANLSPVQSCTERRQRARASHDSDCCSIRVTDGGSGVIDRNAHLRPGGVRAHGGFGLWTVGQVADSAEISRDQPSGCTTVMTVYLVPRRSTTRTSPPLCSCAAVEARADCIRTGQWPRERMKL